MAIDPAMRFTLERVRDHPWFTKYFYPPPTALAADG